MVLASGAGFGVDKRWGRSVMGCCALIGGVVGSAGGWFSWVGGCWAYGRLVDGLRVVVSETVEGCWVGVRRCTVMACSWSVFGVRGGLLIVSWVAGLAGCIVRCILLRVAEAWLGVIAGVSRNRLQFFCDVGWVIVCGMEVLGVFCLMGLVFFVILGGRYGLRGHLVGSLGWS